MKNFILIFFLILIGCHDPKNTEMPAERSLNHRNNEIISENLFKDIDENLLIFDAKRGRLLKTAQANFFFSGSNCHIQISHNFKMNTMADSYRILASVEEKPESNQKIYVYCN